MPHIAAIPAALTLAASTLLTSANIDTTADVPLPSAVFRATHNSYSGNLGGARDSIAHQLDHGIRFIELDIHDNGYATSRDYAVGHDSPGNQVDHAGNPASNLLRDWLGVIDTWSAQHPAAAPIVVALDVKDDLTDNTSYAAGNLAALNQQLTSVFGARLYRAEEYPASPPTVDELRGRVLAVISGDGGRAARTGATSATTRPSRSTAAARWWRCTTPVQATCGTGPACTAPTAASPGCATAGTTAASPPPSR
ncbi:phosphatidylinositol-specific phospholipase C domain-containing protein [Nonomuraea thailandensis]